MMARIVYYIFLFPLSLLPFWMLYLLSDFLYVVLYKGFSYRIKVVRGNITKAFPDYSDREIQKLVSGFYRHFCDLIVEGIKGFTISAGDLDKRYKFLNPNILDDYYQKGKDVIVAAGHFSNWEWATMQSSRILKHTCVGIYTPLTNRFFENKMKKSRSRFGLVLVPKDRVKAYFREKHLSPQLYFFLVDQSPSNPDRAYWANFLGNETAIQFGIEKYSKEFGLPIFFITIMRQKRGYYHLTLKKVLDNPLEKEYGQIITEVYEHLENMILQRPEWWLWSHRRWKHSKKEKESNF